jgi:hypothetical protein
MNRILSFAAVVEIATGAALVFAPRIVAALLVGPEAPADLPLAPFPGIALVALGLACWPGTRPPEATAPALRAMLAYNTLVAFFLAYLSATGRAAGVLLWPAVALHGAVALLLVWSWRRERDAGASQA